MRETVVLGPLADLTDVDREALRELSQAVYPPREATDWPGRRIEWATADWCVRLYDDRGALVSYVGINLRDARLDGRPVKVGGIGGVKTHPAARRRGLAERGMRRADQFFHDQAVAFAVLVCDARLLDYYDRLGWREFTGRLMVLQHGVPAEFTFNRVMTRGIRSLAPQTGTVDLLGPPW